MYKGFINIGKHFVVYAINKTGKLTIYKRGAHTYAKARNYGVEVEGLKNLVPCRPCTFGINKGFIEIV